MANFNKTAVSTIAGKALPRSKRLRAQGLNASEASAKYVPAMGEGTQVPVPELKRYVPGGSAATAAIVNRGEWIPANQTAPYLYRSFNMLTRQYETHVVSYKGGYWLCAIDCAKNAPARQNPEWVLLLSN
ncbi:MAG: hypothetical protein K2M87_01660 [Muribaculaceae bacterium]|nr:hypothetical protein [Muribaculaceae bacterium]